MKKRRILIATDGSEFGMKAVEEACEFIDPKKTEVKVVSAYFPTVYVGTDPSFASSVVYERLDKDLKGVAADVVEKAAMFIREHFPDEKFQVTTQVMRGPAGKEIVDKAEAWHADLIVVRSHGYGFWGRLLGSVSNDVVHHAPCSVLVVRKN
jgi:nucleotide-binding universal stress UspA family protein